MPDWFEDWWRQNRKLILENQFLLEKYQVLHDCGKVDVLVVDEDGRNHYPDHAAKSAEVAAVLFAENPALTESERELLVDLIVNDMLFHTGTREQVAATPKTLSILLAVTALCETHANAEMFGGIESTSFKIKWKKWEKLVRSMA